MTKYNTKESVLKVSVKFLIFKFGKLLLKQDPSLKKWSLIKGSMHSNENLYKGIYNEVLEQSGWETTNIRLFQINANDSIEVIFIVDAIKQTLQGDKKNAEFRWFQLNNLPKSNTLSPNDEDIIYAFAKLIHPGKTLDLEHLPPVFNPKKHSEQPFPQLLQLIRPI